MSRLDGKYEACDWSSEDAVLPPLVDGGNGCQPLDAKKFAGKTVVVRSEGCSQEQAVKNGVKRMEFEPCAATSCMQT